MANEPPYEEEEMCQFGDHESGVRADVDAMVRLLRARHQTPVTIICGLGEENLVEVRYFTRTGIRRSVKATTIANALRSALEE